MARRETWTDERLDREFRAVNGKLDRVLKTQALTRKEQREAAERARRDWLTFFTPVAVATIGLLGTVLTVVLTHQ